MLLRLVGLVPFLGGVALMLWGRWALGPMWGVSTSLGVQLRVHHRLVKHGPYALVRHPMYLGYWLMFAGALIVYRTWALLIYTLSLIFSLYRRARREEQALATTFGPEWHAYTTRVSMFLPRLWWRVTWNG